MRIALVLALLSSACVHTDSSDCGGGTVCREGTVCASISIDNNGVTSTSTECVSEDQLEKCKDAVDGMSCDDGMGTCYSHACLPVGCGNGRMDSGETCDDGNVALGDGCSSSCVAEVCGNGVVDPVDTSSGVPMPKEQCDDANTLSHDGCASTCLPEVLRWRKLSTTPQPRNFATMAVDLTTRKAIMFGGFIVAPSSVFQQNASFVAEPDVAFRGTPNGETWELSESGWSRIDSIPSPSPRGGHVLVHDGTHTLLVGGAQSELAIFKDVWALGNGVWTQLDDLPDEMGSRAGAAAAYWPGHGVILFGGLAGSSQSAGDVAKTRGDTWYLEDGETEWKLFELPIGGPTPEPRVFATLTFDPEDGGKLVLVGGTSSYAEHTQLESWTLDDHGWTQLTAENAPTASGAVAAYDPKFGVVVADGMDKDGGHTTSVWTWKGGTWKAGTSSPGDGRYGASGGVDPISGHLQLFGGGAAPPLSGCTPTLCTDAAGGTDVDLYTSEVLTYTGDEKWSPRNIVPEPPHLMKHSYAYDSDRARVVVFGGLTPDTAKGPDMKSVTNDVYELVEHTFFKPVVTPDSGSGVPAPRHSAAMAYAQFGATRGTYVFGGSTSSVTVAPVNDFWLLQADDDGQLGWHKLPDGPTARSGAGMVFDTARGVLVLFGGSTGDGTRLNDTCEYNGSTWTCTSAATSPDARADAAFAYDPKNHVVVMWGGQGATMPDTMSTPIFYDLWTYDGAWNKATDVTFGPSARLGARFAWDARRLRMVLWGSTNSDTSIWELGGPDPADGTKWSFVPAFDAPTLPRAYSMMIQSADGAVLVHGGQIADSFVQPPTDVLELVRESSTVTPYTSCNSQFDEDHDLHVGCADPDCWAYCTPQCPPGATGADCVNPQPMNLTIPGCGNGLCEKPRENCGICPEDCHPAMGPACPVNP